MGVTELLSVSEIVVPSVEGLAFDEGPHIYRLDGKPVPSVTKIMEPMTRAEYRNIPESVLDRAADRGTAVHNGIELWLKYGLEDIPQEFRGYMDAFAAWWDETQPEYVDSEVRLYHKDFHYVGTADLLLWIGEKLWLVDIKTTSRIISKSCAVQLEAYKQALSSMGLEIQAKGIIQLKKDGKYKFETFKAKDPKAWRMFTALKTVYDYMAE